MSPARHRPIHAAVLVAGLMLALVLAATPADSTRAAQWPADSYVLRVDGLACPYCGYGVEKQFAQRDGVEGTQIDIETGVVVVTVAAGTRFSDAELERIIDRAGFTLATIVHRPRGE